MTIKATTEKDEAHTLKSDKSTKTSIERDLDDQLEDSFPASDPPSLTQPASAGAPDRDEATSSEKKTAGHGKPEARRQRD